MKIIQKIVTGIFAIFIAIFAIVFKIFSFIVSLLQNNKPMIQRQIDKAIQEEKKRLNSIKKDIYNKLSNDQDIDVFQYNMNLIVHKINDDIYEKEFLIVEKATSREMFQTLNKICEDAKYNIENDSATGTVKGYNVFLMRHKGIGKYYISISATKIDIEKFINESILEYKSFKKKKEIPSFIKKAIDAD